MFIEVLASISKELNAIFDTLLSHMTSIVINKIDKLVLILLNGLDGEEGNEKK